MWRQLVMTVNSPPKKKKTSLNILMYFKECSGTYCDIYTPSCMSISKATLCNVQHHVSKLINEAWRNFQVHLRQTSAHILLFLYFLYYDNNNSSGT